MVSSREWIIRKSLIILYLRRGKIFCETILYNTMLGVMPKKSAILLCLQKSSSLDLGFSHRYISDTGEQSFSLSLSPQSLLLLGSYLSVSYFSPFIYVLHNPQELIRSLSTARIFLALKRFVTCVCSVSCFFFV